VCVREREKRERERVETHTHTDRAERENSYHTHTHFLFDFLIPALYQTRVSIALLCAFPHIVDVIVVIVVVVVIANNIKFHFLKIVVMHMHRCGGCVVVVCDVCVCVESIVS